MLDDGSIFVEPSTLLQQIFPIAIQNLWNGVLDL